ncbi:MAG: cysteine hydrolase [Microbacteriaceae bacterium]|nr:cysteine hydrolase [Microbacteriaceae bacterium]
MTTLPNRTHTALLVIDVQNDVVDAAFQRDAVVRTIGSLLDRARTEQVPVVWVQHSADHLPQNSAGWQIVPELTPRPTEPIVHKRHGDAFEATNLEQHLADSGIGRLVVCGAETDACIRSTIHGAFTRGYDVTLVADAHSTSDLTEWGAPPPALVVANVNLYWSFQTAPGRTASVVAAAEVAFVGAAN